MSRLLGNTSSPAANFVDALDQTANFSRNFVWKSPVLVIEIFECETQLIINFTGCRGNKFMCQIMKAIRFHYEMRIPKFLGQRIDHRWKIFRPGQPGFFERPHLLQHNL